MNTRLRDGAAPDTPVSAGYCEQQPWTGLGAVTKIFGKLDPWPSSCEISTCFYCCSAVGPYQWINNNVITPTELCSFRFFIDIALDCAAKVFCAGTSYPLRLQPPWEVLLGVYWSGHGLCACLLARAHQRSVNNQPTWVTADCTESAGAEPCIPKRRGKELPGFLRCSLFCNLLAGARRSHLAPLPAYFPKNWHFPLLSYLPAKLWPVLLLTLIFLFPKVGLATEADVPPSLSLMQWSMEWGSFLLWSTGSRNLLAVIVTEQGREEGQRLTAFSTKWDSDSKALFLTTQLCWTWEKWPPDKLPGSPISC